MAINTNGSEIRTETNVGGEIVDNDEYVATRAAYEHNQQGLPSDNQWASTYKGRLADLYESNVQVDADPALLDANKKDLKIRNIDK